MKKKKTENSDETPLAEQKVSSESAASELREPRWAVVSFEQCVAKNLTYEEAARKIAELEKQKVSGLCLITDEAAERILNKI